MRGGDGCSVVRRLSENLIFVYTVKQLGWPKRWRVFSASMDFGLVLRIGGNG
jgi:hypothetical protein